MGQINLYKIDENKKDDFLNKLTEKFEFIGEQDYNSMETGINKLCYKRFSKNGSRTFV